MSRAIQDATASGRRSSASPSSTSANFVCSGALSTKPRHRRISAASCSCELSHTGCKKSPWAVCARSGSASSAKLHSSSRETGEATIRARPELKPGTRLVREWQGRSYDVLVLDDGFSWQNTRYRSLSAIARKITGTAWSGPLFFGLKPNRPATRRSSQVPGPAGAPTVGSNAAG